MSEEKNTSFVSNEKKYCFGISQKAIIYNPENNQYLLIESIDGYFSKKYGPWDLAGGTMDSKESFEETLNREIKEELGEINYEFVGVVAYEKILNSDNKEKIFLGNLVRWLGGEIKIGGEHKGYKWVTAKEIEQDKEYKPWLKNFIKKAAEYLEREKALDNWKRTQADFENYKKDQAKMMSEFRKFSSLDMVMQILPVLDNFNASLEHVPEDQKDNAWVTGINYIKKQLEDILKNNGVEEIEVRVGDKFDPEVHEAVQQETGSEKLGDGKLENKVKKIVQKGYKIENKIIRVAKVIVE